MHVFSPFLQSQVKILCAFFNILGKHASACLQLLEALAEADRKTKMATPLVKIGLDVSLIVYSDISSPLMYRGTTFAQLLPPFGSLSVIKVV